MSTNIIGWSEAEKEISDWLLDGYDSRDNQDVQAGIIAQRIATVLSAPVLDDADKFWDALTEEFHVESEPGHGFVEDARQCFMCQRFAARFGGIRVTNFEADSPVEVQEVVVTPGRQYALNFRDGSRVICDTRTSPSGVLLSFISAILDIWIDVDDLGDVVSIEEVEVADPILEVKK